MEKDEYFKYRPDKGFGGLSIDEVEMGNRIIGKALDDIFEHALMNDPVCKEILSSSS